MADARSTDVVNGGDEEDGGEAMPVSAVIVEVATVPAESGLFLCETEMSPARPPLVPRAAALEVGAATGR